MGILLINSVSFFIDGLAVYQINRPESQSRLDWWIAAFGEVFVDQKFMGLFSLLFGASFLLFLERVQDRTARPAMLSFWRNVLLLGVGVAHSILWQGDILFVYATCVPLLLLFRHASWWFLCLIGLLLYYGSVVFSFWMTPHLNGEMLEALTRTTPGSEAGDLLGAFFIADAYFRAVGMMLVGMGLYRNGWLRRTGNPELRLFAWGAIVLGALLSGSGVFWVNAKDYAPQALLVGNVPNTMATPWVSLGYLTLIMIWDAAAEGIWVERIRSMGRMALTNYLGQTLVCLSLASLLPPGFASRSGVLMTVVIIWVLQLLGSHAWLTRYRLGPVEWLWRCATYRAWQPLRRSAVRDEAKPLLN